MIPRELDGAVVHQRRADGYVNATALCKAAGKEWAEYWRLDTTKAFIAELSENLGQNHEMLVQATRGGAGGTWVHPQVAIDVAYWCSTKFRTAVIGWVHELLTTGRVELPGTNVAIVARIDAAASNARRGLKRTNADKRAAVERMLTLRPEWSDRRVAEHVGVDHKFVGSVRRELVGTVPTSEPQRREGKGGRISTVPPKEKPAKSTTANDIGYVDQPGHRAAGSRSESKDGEPAVVGGEPGGVTSPDGAPSQ